MEQNNLGLLEAETPISRADIVALVNRIYFRNVRESEELRDWMLRDFHPWIPLAAGRTAPPTALFRSPVAEILPAYFLGVNTTILSCDPSQPASRRKATSSNESTDVAESNDDLSSFECHHLGELEHYDDEELLGSMEEAAVGLWSSTGYYVVDRIALSGRVYGIYILWDIFFVHGESLTHERGQIAGEDWGYMPPPDEMLTCARIEDRLDEMNFNKRLEGTEVV
ncbi:hypothetical protein SLS56_009958 [Neofusicoccum ribis]|uniref:Uncharacterized protein n=1 Tax=Neofusicoccum ribis TaxID=45134 RepID=A0ABR3SFS8_9PEZI